MNIIYQWIYKTLDSYTPQQFMANPSLEEYARRMNYTREMK